MALMEGRVMTMENGWRWKLKEARKIKVSGGKQDFHFAILSTIWKFSDSIMPPAAMWLEQFFKVLNQLLLYFENYEMICNSLLDCFVSS